MNAENLPVEIFNMIAEILAEILDVELPEISPETYVVRDLGAESIDLMELAVSLNERFGIEIDEEVLFLRSLRPVLEKARETSMDPTLAAAERFDFLGPRRIAEIMDDLDDGPVLKVADLVRYVRARMCKDAPHAG